MRSEIRRTQAVSAPTVRRSDGFEQNVNIK